VNTDDKPTHADLPMICGICAIRISDDAKKVVTKDIIDYCPHLFTFVIARARGGMIAGWDLSAPLLPEHATRLRDEILKIGREAGKGAGDVVAMVRKPH
jgi:hypothetical protein